MKDAFLVTLSEPGDQLFSYLVMSNDRVKAQRAVRRTHNEKRQQTVTERAEINPFFHPLMVKVVGVVNVEPKWDGKNYLARIGGRKLLSDTPYADRMEAVRVAVEWLKNRDRETGGKQL